MTTHRETYRARFAAKWARKILADCKAAGVPAFMKQVGSGVRMHPNGLGRGRYVRDMRHESYVLVTHPKGGDPAQWPEDLRVREYPEQKNGR